MLALVFLVSPNTIPISASTWTPLTTAGTRHWFSIASSIDGKKLVAAPYGVTWGAGDYIYHSSDSGLTWVPETSSGIQSWYSVTSSADGTKLAAVHGTGTMDYIYTSTDSGVTWTPQTGSGLSFWGYITSTPDGSKLVACSGDGHLYMSTDSGVTWVLLTGAGMHSWDAVAMSSDGTKMIAGTLGGYIYTSSDSGATWVARTSAGMGSPYAYGWFSVASSPDGTKLAAVNNDPGYIYTSTDSGATWVAHTGPGLHDWRTIVSSADGTLLAAVDEGGTSAGGYIYTSIDGGTTWTAETSAGIHNWRWIAPFNNGKGLVAVDANGYIYTNTPPSSGLPVAASVVDPGAGIPSSTSAGGATALPTSGFSITPSSGAVGTSVTLNWPGTLPSTTATTVSVESTGTGGEIKQFRIPAGGTNFCFPATLYSGGEGAISNVNVVSGTTYNVSLATSTIKSGIVPFTVTDGTANGCTSSAIQLIRAKDVVALTQTSLDVGASNANVATLQNVLIQNGYLTGPATGYFGTKTQSALKAFQTKSGLPVVGRMGPKTAAAIAQIAVTDVPISSLLPVSQPNTTVTPSVSSASGSCDLTAAPANALKVSQMRIPLSETIPLGVAQPLTLLIALVTNTTNCDITLTGLHTAIADTPPAGSAPTASYWSTQVLPTTSYFNQSYGSYAATSSANMAVGEGPGNVSPAFVIPANQPRRIDVSNNYPVSTISGVNLSGDVFTVNLDGVYATGTLANGGTYPIDASQGNISGLPLVGHTMTIK